MWVDWRAVRNDGGCTLGEDDWKVWLLVLIARVITALLKFFCVLLETRQQY